MSRRMTEEPISYILF